MRVAILISSMDGGGAAKIVSNISTRLPEDWDIDIILNNADKLEFPYKGRIISLDMNVPLDKDSILYQFKVFWKRIRLLKKLKKERRYDCCISYMDSANLVNILTSNGTCKTVINVVNNMSASAKYNWKFRLIVNPVIKRFYNKADLIFALSMDVKNDLVDNYGIINSKIKVSYCSIVLEEIDKLIRENKGMIDDWFDINNTVITAGRLNKQKGQWHLIRAFSRVCQVLPNAKLCIFGFGELEEYLKKLVVDYKMENNVKMFGFSNMLDAYIANSALFVFPSLYEGFGTALQEALGCQVACLATDYQTGGREQLSPEYTGKITGIYKGKYGILIPNCSENMLDAIEPLEKEEIILADAIIELLSDKKLREDYAKRARIRSSEYDINRIVELWVRDLNECVGRNENE